MFVRLGIVSVAMALVWRAALPSSLAHLNLRLIPRIALSL